MNTEGMGAKAATSKAMSKKRLSWYAWKHTHNTEGA